MGKSGGKNTYSIYPGNFGAWLTAIMQDWDISGSMLGREIAAVDPLGKRKEGLQRKARGGSPYTTQVGQWMRAEAVPGKHAAFRLGAALLSLGVRTCGVQTVARVVADHSSYEVEGETGLIEVILRSSAASFANISFGDLDYLRSLDAAFRTYHAVPYAERPYVKIEPNLIIIFELLHALGTRRER